MVRLLFEHLSSTLLGLYEVELLSHVMILYVTYCTATKLFPHSSLYVLYSCQQWYGSSVSILTPMLIVFNVFLACFCFGCTTWLAGPVSGPGIDPILGSESTGVVTTGLSGIPCFPYFYHSHPSGCEVLSEFHCSVQDPFLPCRGHSSL